MTQFDANQLSVEGFLAFARSKPADEQYRYTSPGRCAFAQYVQSIVGETPTVQVTDMFVIVGTSRYLANDYPQITIIDHLAHNPSNMNPTFGWLAERLQAEVHHA